MHTRGIPSTSRGGLAGAQWQGRGPLGRTGVPALAEVHLQGWTDRGGLHQQGRGVMAGEGALAGEGVHKQGRGAPVGEGTHCWQGWGHWPGRGALA